MPNINTQDLANRLYTAALLGCTNWDNGRHMDSRIQERVEVRALLDAIEAGLPTFDVPVL